MEVLKLPDENRSPRVPKATPTSISVPFSFACYLVTLLAQSPEAALASEPPLIVASARLAHWSCLSRLGSFPGTTPFRPLALWPVWVSSMAAGPRTPNIAPVRVANLHLSRH